MIQFILYATTAGLYIILGLFIGLLPQKALDLLKIVKDKNQFFLFGIFEIVVSLSILYFRYETKIPLLITLAGLLLFLDGILYLIGTKVLDDNFDILMNIEIRTFRLYSLLFFAYALILIIGLF
ncbi:MAG: hypothetical protein JXQ65_07705 [Candidatus Marinimicrobia bacterium]|nr:hypothetical protein [Candidatus Neomarinimicrobiota bacterium]